MAREEINIFEGFDSDCRPFNARSNGARHPAKDLKPPTGNTGLVQARGHCHNRESLQKLRFELLCGFRVANRRRDSEIANSSPTLRRMLRI
jgi:hypothetical protein